MATILVADDHPTNRDFLVALLGYQNHRLLEASDGAEALAVVRAERPKVVITDILMPTMDGYEFVRRLRADPAIATTAVIFYTARYHKLEARYLAQSCGVEHILIKPCEPELILRTVDQVLGARSQHVSSRYPPQDFDHEHLRVVTDKLSDTADRLTAANQRLNALVDIGLQLASERDPRRMLGNVCRSARELIGAKYAVLAVGNRDEEHIACVATSGMDAETAKGLGSPTLREGVLGTALIERKPYRLTNLGGDPQRAGLPAYHPPVHSLLVAPIVSLAKSYGWICLTDKVGTEEFTEEDERLLAILAAQTGRIYDNGSLHAEVQRNVVQLEVEVTERKESELRFRQLAENIREVFFLLNAHSTQILYVSPAYEEVWGRSCESLYSQPQSWMDSTYPDDLEVVAKGNRERDENGRFSYEYRIVRPDGALRWIWARGFPIRDEAGEVYRIAGVAEDVTERKQSEEVRAQLAAIVESSADAIIGTSLEGTIVSWNAGAERLFGYAGAEIVGKNLSVLIPSDRLDEDTPILARLRRGEHVDHFETLRQRKDGSLAAVSLAISPIRDSAGHRDVEDRP